MIKVGIVGCGQMGLVHAIQIKNLSKVELVGVADQNIKYAQQLACRVGVNIAVASLEELITLAGTDAIHILTPPTTHKELACQAIALGCHVYVEKPVALTVKDGHEIFEAARANQKIVTAGFNHLFEPVVQKAKEYIYSGRIGHLVGLNIYHNSLPIASPWVNKLPSGPWINDFDHLIYLSDLFLGNAKKIVAIGYPTRDKKSVAEVHVGIQHEKGWSSLTYSTLTAPFKIGMTIYGSKRILELDLISELIIEHRDFNVHRWLRKGLQSLYVATQLVSQTGFHTVRVLSGKERGWHSLKNLLTAFYAAISNNGNAPVPPEKAIYVIETKEHIRSILQRDFGIR